MTYSQIAAGIVLCLWAIFSIYHWRKVDLPAKRDVSDVLGTLFMGLIHTAATLLLIIVLGALVAGILNFK